MSTSPVSQITYTDSYIDDPCFQTGEQICNRNPRTCEPFAGYSSRTIALLSDCTLCPRSCHVNRLAGEKGFCGQDARISAARASLHMWEEPCISGTSGSGTVFFCGCNLKCIFCQNRNIALGEAGSGMTRASGAVDCPTTATHPITAAHPTTVEYPVTVGRTITCGHLAEIFLSLQEKGANNINLVTPSHFVPQICDALVTAKSQGLHIPIVYNTSSYESVDTLKLLDGLVDIYLPDLKYYSEELSLRYSHTKDYFSHASEAIAEMVRQVGTPVFYQRPVAIQESDVKQCSGNAQLNAPAETTNQTLMKKGVIVRHLILPGQTKDSKKILRYLHNTYGNDIYISIMNQYTPLPHVADIPELNRKVTSTEYDRVLDFALRIGIENGFFQEGEAASESFIPEFDGQGL